MLVGGVALLVLAPGGLRPNAGTVLAIPAVAGIALLLYSGVARIASSMAGRSGLRIAIVCGLLAFPIFVGHGIVIPVKGILEGYGAPSAIALGLPVLAFFALLGWLALRLDRVMFGFAREG